MAWDFSTEPEFQEQLDWMRQFVREEIWPLETIADELSQEQLDRVYAPLQEEVKRRGLWAAHLSPDLGGQGFGQLKLGMMHEILGTSAYAPNAFGNAAPDSGNSEILALAGTDEQKERWLYPLLAGDLKSAFSMTEPEVAGSDPTTLRTRGGPRGRRVRHQRPQVVLDERVDRRLPDRHGGHGPRRAAAPARVDDHRPGRHAGGEHRPRHRDDGAPDRGLVRQARQPRRDPLRGRARPGRQPARRRGRRLPHRPAPPRPRPDPPLHAVARRLEPRVRHALRALALPRGPRHAAGREADHPELDRRLRGADARRAADDAARRVEDGHARAPRPRAARSR